MHLYKVPSQFSDLFISKIDFEKREIDYQVRDKEGCLMEPKRTSKFVVINDNMTFDLNRTIHISLMSRIINTLHGETLQENQEVPLQPRSD